MKRILSLGIALLLFSLMLLPVVCVADTEPLQYEKPELRLQYGGREYAGLARERSLGVRIQNGVQEEVIETTTEVELWLTEDDKLIPREGTGEIGPMSSISEDEYFLSKAVKWEGSIVYTKYTIDGFTCYRPTSFSHKLTVLDSGFVLTQLTAYGGATGWGFDVSNNKSGKFSIGPVKLSKSNPSSGSKYSKSLSNTKYAFAKDPGTGHINTYGTFKYYRVRETGQPIRTSAEFSVELL